MTAVITILSLFAEEGEGGRKGGGVKESSSPSTLFITKFNFGFSPCSFYEVSSLRVCGDS